MVLFNGPYSVLDVVSDAEAEEIVLTLFQIGLDFHNKVEGLITPA